ncbi:hypothetical protein GGR53DRAFT_528585 [Hypoxylon sp. FL1150]|nr:hypothetical protein GGR53DRAFT_528585 [Hypoxylon sp. FL1150]
MPPESFPLMACPREIRDMIYRETLCSMGFDANAPGGIIVTDKMNTALLRVNRQVSAEASQAMLRTNLFIGVTVDGVDLISAFAQLHLHIPVVFSGTNPPTIRNLAMKYTIVADPRTSGHKQYFVILRRHFDKFCHAIFFADALIPDFSLKTRHKVELQPFVCYRLPWMGWKIPYYISIGHKHRSLLEPYQKHLYLCGKFIVDGCVSPELSEQVVAKVKRGLNTSPEVLLEDLLRYQALEQECVNRNDRFGALEAQIMITHRVYYLAVRDDGNSWYEVKNQMSVEQQHLVTSIYSSAQAKLGHTLLLDLVDLMGRNVQELHAVAFEKFETACLNYNDAMTAGEALETDWKLPVHDYAHLCFLIANLCHLMRAELGGALWFIETARTHIPDCPAIQELYWEIQMWKEHESYLNFRSARLRSRWI